MRILRKIDVFKGFLTRYIIDILQTKHISILLLRGADNVILLTENIILGVIHMVEFTPISVDVNAVR